MTKKIESRKMVCGRMTTSESRALNKEFLPLIEKSLRETTKTRQRLSKYDEIPILDENDGYNGSLYIKRINGRNVLIRKDEYGYQRETSVEKIMEEIKKERAQKSAYLHLSNEGIIKEEDF
ncbi:hypothetical protein AUJ10_01655 [Candidatus Pacearchaeota archaeon CG1_02_31_27]|nr:MAG: hypothetical protein AUJ10_01655 [Candidatus Pacearchaeota archaeon CG1_02_31_27]PIN92615.1 MAG: hypothetical protein COU55_00355 [Candidatus Pacearchaeota archaeon CG10_big_fil_rev_8_21_14_0_10_31_59]PIZ81201.1 MAG: hypothetical protein COX99_00440 [Candidatus Pacearchaeota archaeon CG_4_10_14_0_2_um_filter_31_10]